MNIFFEVFQFSQLMRSLLADWLNLLTALLSQANGRKSGAKGKRNATKTVLPDEKRIQQTSKRSRSNTKYGLTEAKKLLG